MRATRAILFVFLAATLCFWGSGCGSSDKSTPPSVDSKTFTSSVDASHSHTVTLTRVEVDSPPALGIQRATSVSGSHSHTFTMSPSELAAVLNGTPVVVTTSLDSGHTHRFTIQKWY